MFKIIVVALLVLIVGSLFTALAFIARNQGNGEHAARALTLRISLSLLLFAILMASYYLGVVQAR